VSAVGLYALLQLQPWSLHWTDRTCLLPSCWCQTSSGCEGCNLLDAAAQQTARSLDSSSWRRNSLPMTALDRIMQETFRTADGTACTGFAMHLCVAGQERNALGDVRGVDGPTAVDGCTHRHSVAASAAVS
jgi:hypothetical protein